MMSQLAGRMVVLAFFLLCISTATGQETEQGTKCEDGTCILDEEELHAIIQKAYRLGYSKGYREGSKERQILQITPGTGGSFNNKASPPSINWVVPQGQERIMLPSLPGVSTGR